VPSSTDLQQVEYNRPTGAEQALAAALAQEAEEAGGRSPYDVTLIDAAPSLGLVTVATLTAGDEALVPIKIGGLDMKGMASLHKTIRSVQRKTNPKLGVGAILLTAWDKSTFAGSSPRRCLRTTRRWPSSRSGAASGRRRPPWLSSRSGYTHPTRPPPGTTTRPPPSSLPARRDAA
jgi:hypothetical protein